MPANLATRVLFLLPWKLTSAQFFASLANFTLNNWCPDSTIDVPWISTIHVTDEYDPISARVTTDLQFLYMVVHSMGGYDALELEKRWHTVAEAMNSSWPEDQDEIRTIYRNYLWCYEVYSRKVRRLFTARKRMDRNPREYPPQALITGQGDNDKEDFQVACMPWSALESRIECEIQGTLDGFVVLRDYFSISPALQLAIENQTNIQAVEVFTNPPEGVSAYFTRPESISPSSAASFNPDSEYGISDNDDEILSEEAVAYKNAILADNRNYILRTQAEGMAQPLPPYPQEHLAYFMYDEIIIGARRPKPKKYPSLVVDSESNAMGRSGFGAGPVRVRPPSYKSHQSDDGYENEKLAYAFERGYINSEIEGSDFQKELIEKYGVKPYVDRSAEAPRVEKERLNFQQYLLAHGIDSEVRRFFDDRLRLEGGFWKHELRRMEELERRVRGDPEISLKGWEIASNDGSKASSSSHDSYDGNSSIIPLQDLTQRPMSLHEYARRIAKRRKEPLEWDCLTPARSVDESVTPPRQHAPPGPENSEFVMHGENLELNPSVFEPSYLPRCDEDGVDFRNSDVFRTNVAFQNGTVSPETQQFLGSMVSGTAASVPSGQINGISQVQEQVPREQAIGEQHWADYPESTLSTTSSAVDRLYPIIPDPISVGNTRKILALPNGMDVDITNVNPRNPPWYNYTQEWLKQRGSDEDNGLWKKDSQTHLEQESQTHGEEESQDDESIECSSSRYLPSDSSWRNAMEDDELLNESPQRSKTASEQFDEVDEVVCKTLEGVSITGAHNPGLMEHVRRAPSEEGFERMLSTPMRRPLASFVAEMIGKMENMDREEWKA